MKNGITRARRFGGLNVHPETIAVAVAEGEAGEARSLGIISNRVSLAKIKSGLVNRVNFRLTRSFCSLTLERDRHRSVAMSRKNAHNAAQPENLAHNNARAP